MFSDLGKIGEIVEVIFPEELISEKLAGHGQVEYDARTLLGSTSVGICLNLTDVLRKGYSREYV